MKLNTKQKALISAVKENDTDSVRRFIQQGESVDLYGRINIWSDKYTLLSMAIKKGYSGMVKLLLELGADVNFFKDNYTSPVCIAASGEDTDMLEMLLDNKNLKLETIDQDVPFLFFIIKKNNASLLRKALEKNVFLKDVVSNTGVSALSYAVENEYAKSARILLEEYGANIELKDEKGRTALHHAANSANFDAVKMLIKSGAALDVIDNNGYTILMRLISPVDCSYSSYSIYDSDSSCSSDSSDIELNSKDEELRNLYEILLTDLNTQKNLEHKNKDGATVLHVAILNTDTIAVRALIKAGASVNTTFGDEDETPLIMAVKKRSIEIISLLVSHPDFKNIDSQDKKGKTALYHAIKGEITFKKIPGIIKILCGAGASLNVMSKDSISPYAKFKSNIIGKKHDKDSSKAYAILKSFKEERKKCLIIF